MKGRLWWSSVLPATAALCLFANLAQAQTGPRLVGSGPDGAFNVSARDGNANRPGLIDPTCGLVGGPAVASASCDSQGGREWEGVASTDYFTVEPQGVLPNPDIAVGPDDIVTVVNRIIARYPNPNAPSGTNNNGTASVDYNPTGTNYFPPTSRQFLDVWLGEVALNELCPTQPRTNATCVVDNASVRYDQMQGRFVVLFTVVDNALINCFGCADLPTGANANLTRKASWVLIVSKWATGCQGSIALGSGGSNVGGTCTPNNNPAVPGLPGNTEFFTTPQPPGPNQNNPNSGGTNSNWIAYYGKTDGTCDATCRDGNINSISDRNRGVAAPTGAVTIDCRNTAVTTAAAATTTVCYFPTSARLGIDNDNLYIVSSVINDNIPTQSYTPPRSWIAIAPADTESAAWEGTRLRVLKKAGFYTGATSSVEAACTAAASKMCPGAASPAVTQLQGDYYDLWGDSPKPYAFDRVIPNQVILNGATRSVVGLHYEPEHVRGRSLASYNGNANVAPLTGGAGVPFYSIWGAVDQGATLATPAQHQLYHRTITYSHLITGSLGANVASIPATVNDSKIQGGIPRLQGRAAHQVPAFTNPNSVTQRDRLTQPGNSVTPYLYVGDDRPHRVISREGHRYIARVGQQAQFAQFSGTTSSSTVIYDIVQKLTSTGAALEVYNTAWGNGDFYAPMHDTPANVVQYGAISPINVQPFLEKLFVGTTFPPLAPTDPRTFSYGLISGQALQACKGQEPSVTTANRAYAGLFDIRCGEDAYDTPKALQHPTTGSYLPADFQVRAQPQGFTNSIVPFGIRGGAATDPNNMGMWTYGAYAKGRLASVPGFGQWGTYVAHYPLTFPLRDPYNNLILSYSDVPPGHPFFSYIQIAKQTEIAPGSRTATVFDVNGVVKRRDMAQWVVRAQMDEQAVTNYLNATGGIFCSFADVNCPGTTGAVTNGTGTSEWRYIELMYRRGYTKGCNATTDAQRRFCPGDNLSRGQMSAFIIRAKMNSVFPTVTSGAATASCLPTGTAVTQVGDQFGLYAGCNPYFSDVPNNHTFFAFIQKMRELRISNGTSYSTATALGTYGPDDPLTRGQLMTFLVRAFFP
ncbi:MAG: S-layer homology domain-containing protein [Bryobacteraceae bacterium]